LTPSFEGNLLTQLQKFCSRETRGSTLSDGENPASLSHLGLVRYRVVTDRQTDGRTDRIAISSTRLALRAIAGKSRFIFDESYDCVKVTGLRLVESPV